MYLVYRYVKRGCTVATFLTLQQTKMSGRIHSSAALHHGKDVQYPLGRKLNSWPWVGPRNSGTVEERKVLPLLTLCFRSVTTAIQGWRGTRWRSWLRHCATSRKVTGSIPDGVIGIFQWLNPSGRTMAMESTQPLTEMSTRNPSWE
jgi:hypothetical protein